MMRIAVARSLATGVFPRHVLTSTSTSTSTPLFRCCSSFNPNANFFDVIDIKDLNQQYGRAKEFLKSKKIPADINPRSVFSNTELNLADIDVYGFDYDYTLASYGTAVETFIHDTAKQYLVQELKYPKSLLNVKYDPKLTVRGLHYDVHKGLLLKMDQNFNIQLGTVLRGRETVPDEEVIKLYSRLKIPQDYVESHLQTGEIKMVQLVDIFAKPMMCLLTAVIQWFMDKNVQYVPESIYFDVCNGIDHAHPLFHSLVAESPTTFLEKNDRLVPYLNFLKEKQKKIFLITNSPFELVNAGMTHMVSSDWNELFDVIIVQANKPRFFKTKAGHFRKYLPEKKILSYNHISQFKPGRIYARGNLGDLKLLTQWEDDRVLYFGDHPYADLADLSMNHGWRTGAIIQELDDEICVMNSPEYKEWINWATVLQLLVETNQDNNNDHDRMVVRKWQDELDQLRQHIKELYNPNFGSMFRTHMNSTYFSRRLFRFSDIYTSKVTNMDQYPITHCFYPRRGALPHDFRSWFV